MSNSPDRLTDEQLRTGIQLCATGQPGTAADMVPDTGAMFAELLALRARVTELEAEVIDREAATDAVLARLQTMEEDLMDTQRGLEKMLAEERQRVQVLADRAAQREPIGYAPLLRHANGAVELFSDTDLTRESAVTRTKYWRHGFPDALGIVVELREVGKP